ncbi:isoprenoid synthase domain-containing protein [Chaetomium sp. MPI-CAGE-AT-0009]|nr:isoprenoid synthase domain-containing protein [Chaetomium sp. MPI-CAGE-AT-0009]
MDYPNSVLVDPSTYDTTMDGLCTNMPLRVHRNASLADRGALRAQRDWQRLFGSLPPGYSGLMGPEHNFVSTCMPEILPERLELVAYMTEAMCLVDDMMDEAESPTALGLPYYVDMLTAHDVIKKGGDVSSCSPAARIMARFGKAMYDVDAEGAENAFWWLRQAMTTFNRPSNGQNIRDLDEYLEYRRLNIGSQALIGAMIFGMGLSIPEAQQQACLDLSQPFWLQLAIANDYHSWERESKAAINNGQASVTNAIWILMNKHSMTCDEAKAVCRERARQYAAEYEQVVEAAKAREDLCQDAKRLLEQLKFAMTGNIVWSRQCLRYHGPNRKLNATQLEMAEAIRADESDSWDYAEPKTVNDATEQSGVDANGALLSSAVTNGGLVEVDLTNNVPALGTEILEAPSRYIDSLPGKGIRGKTINALNIWYNVPPRETAIILRVTDLLHGASLMLDDIQDSSQLRRGKPAAHMVFGSMQTINSAGYRFVDALMEVRKLDPRCLYIGQSYDLAWTCNLDCPTEEEYLAMVDNKTAGLYRMLALLLDAQSDSPTKPDVTLLTRFMTLLGRLFQIRDDYMNLTSADQKGFCEDLDEGKYSLPLIYALGRCTEPGSATTTPRDASSTAVLRNLLSQRHVSGRMGLDQKKLFLEYLEKQGGLEYTRRALDAIQVELKALTDQMGMQKNASLRELLQTLEV